MRLIIFNIRMIINKITFILLSVSLLLILLVCLINKMNLDIKEADYMNEFIYFQNCIFYIKLILYFISIYLFSSSITNKGDFTAYTLVMFNYNRFEMLISKVISCILIIFTLTLIAFILFLGVGIFINGFSLKLEYSVTFINVFLCSIIFGLISFNLMELINNYFVIIISCILVLLITGIEGNGDIVKIVLIFLPKIEEDGYTMYGFIHLIWLIIMYFFSGFFIYYNKDLNY